MVVFGSVCAHTASHASTGFAANLRDGMYRNIQRFSFANIDKYSTAGLVTRMTTDVTNVQNAFQMITRIAVRSPLTLIFSMIAAFVINPGLAGVFLIPLVLLGVVLLWCLSSNRLMLAAVHPALASSRGISVRRNETLFTVCIAVVVTLAMSWVGLMVINSLLVLPAASARNVARNLRQYHLLSVLGALGCSLAGLVTAYYAGCSAGAAIALYLALYFTVTFCMRKSRA
mgnify:CR=1 FL=1